MKFDVVYGIQERESWKGKEGIQIKSNMSDDKLIECELSKSLIVYLKKESAILEPDKLLLNFAALQRKGIEENLDAMDNLALRAKTRADSAQEKILKAYQDSEDKYLELEKKFDETTQRFTDKMFETRKKLDKNVEYLEKVSKRLLEIDSYNLERLSTTLESIISMFEKDAALVELVLKHKAKE